MPPLERPPHDPPDRVLVDRARGGDKDAFGVLAERYYRMISLLAYQKVRNRTDAEDVVQESFVRAFRALDSLREAEKFGGWLAQIALKICLDHIRRQGRHDVPVPLDEAAHAGPAPAQPALAAMEAEEEQTRIRDAIGRLPEKYRLVVTMRFVEKRSYREIAEILGEPDGTVANRIHRAVKMLQGRLDPVKTPSEENVMEEDVS